MSDGYGWWKAVELNEYSIQSYESMYQEAASMRCDDVLIKDRQCREFEEGYLSLPV